MAAHSTIKHHFARWAAQHSSAHHWHTVVDTYHMVVSRPIDGGNVPESRL